jgi:hypothetical protein
MLEKNKCDGVNESDVDGNFYDCKDVDHLADSLGKGCEKGVKRQQLEGKSLKYR